MLSQPANATQTATLCPAFDVGSTGLWSADENAFSDLAGTYALIIGVSKYQHFDGGDADARAPRTYGLGQLFSSAYSSFSFFDWLRTSFRATGSPVRKVWLLLSPTDDEKKLIPSESYAPASYSVVENGIRAWYKTLSALSGDAATRSRSLFFFSGHGIEINTDKQVLLPADYLSTDPPMLSNAISTYNLRLGLGIIKVPLQYFFIDACRSDVEELRQQNGFDGAKILLESFAGQNPKRNAPIIYATSTGENTYQSTVPQKMSFFARGLLNGLNLAPDNDLAALTPERDKNGTWVVKLGPLCEYVNTSMNRSLVEAGGKADDPLTIGGTQKVAPPLIVTEVVGPRGAEAMRESIGPTATVGECGDHGIGTRPISAKEVQGREKLFLDSVRPVNDFGHEFIDAFFREARWHVYNTNAWVPARHLLAIERIEGLGSDYRRVCFKLPDPSKWHWLQCANSFVEYAFLFPPSDREHGDVEYAVETTAYASKKEASQYAGLGKWRAEARAVLSPHNSLQNIKLADELWRSYNAGNHSDAFSQILKRSNISSVGDALEVLYNKWESPIAATIASIIVLRAGEDRPSFVWQRNVAHKAAFSSDASIFALQCMIQSDTYVEARAQKCILEVAALGLPLSSEALSYLTNMAGILRAEYSASLVDPALARIAKFGAIAARGSLFLAITAPRDTQSGSGFLNRLLYSEAAS